jgi:hypothetical protein
MEVNWYTESTKRNKVKKLQFCNGNRIAHKKRQNSMNLFYLFLSCVQNAEYKGINLSKILVLINSLAWFLGHCNVSLFEKEVFLEQKRKHLLGITAIK